MPKEDQLRDRHAVLLNTLPAFSYFWFRGFLEPDAVCQFINLNGPLIQILLPFSPLVHVNFLYSYTTVILHTKPLGCSWSKCQRGMIQRMSHFSLLTQFCLGMLFFCKATGKRWKLLLLAQISQIPNAKTNFNKPAKQKALLKVRKGYVGHFPSLKRRLFYDSLKAGWKKNEHLFTKTKHHWKARKIPPRTQVYLSAL